MFMNQAPMPESIHVGGPCSWKPLSWRL